LRVNQNVTDVDEDYREAEAKAYQSMGIGCLLVAVALLIAVGAALWLVFWYFDLLIRAGRPFG
jgi:hypothetical protein